MFSENCMRLKDFGWLGEGGGGCIPYTILHLPVSIFKLCDENGNNLYFGELIFFAKLGHKVL